MKSLVIFLFLFFLLAEPKKTIHIMHICLPRFGSSDLRLNVDYAFEIINNQSSLLPNHELKALTGVLEDYKSGVSAF